MRKAAIAATIPARLSSGWKSLPMRLGFSAQRAICSRRWSREPPKQSRAQCPASFRDGAPEIAKTSVAGSVGTSLARKSVVEGKSVTERVELGGRRVLTKKKNTE